MIKILIVKGNKFQAAQAAADRGIPMVYDHESAPAPDMIETIGLSSATEDALNAWLIEPPTQAPYPVGTLLFWGHAKA